MPQMYTVMYVSDLNKTGNNYFFSYLIIPTNTSRTILNNSGDKEHPLMKYA